MYSKIDDDYILIINKQIKNLKDKKIKYLGSDKSKQLILDLVIKP